MNSLQKPAITSLELHPLIKNRWSPRSFNERAVEPEKLQRVFEAARWSPSAFNEQPWRFIVGLKPDNTWNKLLESLVEWNRNWAFNAPVLISVLGKKTLSKNGNPNTTYQYDTGQAAAWLTVQAAHEGLIAHQMGGFDPAIVCKSFSVPEDYEPITVIAIGYQGKPENLQEEYRKAEIAQRNRKESSELVFSDKFGAPSMVLRNNA
ncbi:MAG TPA: nitroreductase family protein [Bacteroidales bacterium]|nr:nitroreductase family protein [Bacteroidales bacterium]